MNNFISTKKMANGSEDFHNNILKVINNLNEVYSELNLPLINQKSPEGGYFLSKEQMIDISTFFDTKARIQVNRSWLLKQKEEDKDPSLHIIKVNNEFELSKVAVELFCYLKNKGGDKNKLTPREMEVMMFYATYGISKETRELIKESLGLTDKNLNQINSNLIGKKLIYVDRYNIKKKYVSDELTEFIQSLRDKDNKSLKINIVKL